MYYTTIFFYIVKINPSYTCRNIIKGIIRKTKYIITHPEMFVVFQKSVKF